MEKKIQKLLVKIDPAYERGRGRGFFYKQMPSNFSRFYMREQLAFIQYNWDGIKNLKMLDYGCGVGTFMLYMWHHGYTDIEGRDVSIKEVETTKKLFNAFGCPFTATHVEMDAIYDITGDFHIIFFNDFLYVTHLDVPRILKNTKKALVQHGFVCLDLFEHQGKHPSPHRQYFSEAEVRKIAVEAGYVVVMVVIQDTGERKALYILKKRE